MPPQPRARPGSSSSALVTNGNFTSVSGGTGGGQVGYNETVTGWINSEPSGTLGYTFLFTPAAAAGSGVTGNEGGVAFWNASNASSWPSSAGANSATMTVSQVTPPGGGNIIAADGGYQVTAFQQLVNNLVAGTTYTLTFYAAAAQQQGSSYTSATSDFWTACFSTSSTCTAQSSAGTTSANGTAKSTALINNNPGGFSGWTAESFTFTATGTSEWLSFIATGTPTGEPPFALLSDVTLSGLTTAPEPTSLALFGVGVLGIGALRLRRMAKDRAASA